MKQYNKSKILPSTAEIVIIAFCAAIFIIIAILMKGDRLARFDLPIISFIQGGASQTLTRFMVAVSTIGSVKSITLLTAIISVVIFILRRYLLGLYLILSVAFGAGVMNQLLKALFHRERPNILRFASEHGYSFPSGHSMGSVIFFGGLMFILYQLKKRDWITQIALVASIILIVLIGISRVYLGVHYPSDVIAGFTFGVIWLLGSFYVFRLYKKNI